MKHKIDLVVEALEKNTYHLFINLTINGIACRLLLDTGASKTVFDSERVLRFVNSKKVKANESKSVGLGVSEMETHVTVLKKIQFGKFKMKKMEVAVLPIGHVNGTYQQLGFPEIDGVLGSDFLMKYDAVIDYGKKVVKLSWGK
jgi:hypothetical protein